MEDDLPLQGTKKFLTLLDQAFERRAWHNTILAAHDLYHTGQIQLLKRLHRSA